MPPVEVRRVVTERHPAPALVDASKGASLLVVGNRGHGEFAGVQRGVGGDDGQARPGRTVALSEDLGGRLQRSAHQVNRGQPGWRLLVALSTTWLAGIPRLRPLLPDNAS